MEFNALVSSILFAKPGAKALHTTATPQEVTFFTPRAPHIQFKFRVRPFPPIPSSVLALPQRWKYKPLLDPSVDDAPNFCMNLRKLAQDGHCLFYYNGHGIPKPTASGELWVFSKSYLQYIPVSLWDLQN